MWSTLPEFGFIVLCAVLVAATYTFVVSLVAGAGRPLWLASARTGSYGTIALVGLAVLLLAHAFVAHDFTVRYVAHYSDRSMSTIMLLAALWGGQDGSLLWWLFLTCLFSGIAVWWMKGRFRQLQPYTIATLMVVLVFLAVVMLFAVNPYATLPTGAPPDGRGLNYQLRNFYMIVHPPSLYIGFTSAAVPFALATAALIAGKLDNAWVAATRKWMLFSWLFLTIGNGLGMVWAYEELGWGGYWNWDPVENASLLPWLTATPYVHSILVQERRGMFKVWNLVLIALTFLLTLFGTFLTRSGLISSVHAFAQSGVGTYFLVFMGMVAVVFIGLLLYRLPMLRNECSIQSPLSREFAVLVSNWAFVLVMLFVLVATIWPRLSEWFFGATANIGPPFYNVCVPPLGLVLLALMGVAPLLGWRRTRRDVLLRSFLAPAIVMVVVAGLHLGIGSRFGYPAFVHVEPIFPGWLGRLLSAVAGKLPVVAVGLVAFTLAVVVQEIVRGTRARQRQTEEALLVALGRLLIRARRRYAGLLVHVGIALMFFGFVGRAWGVTAEASLSEGERMRIGSYELALAGTRIESDAEKRSFITDVDVFQNGHPIARLSPHRNQYKASPEQPSTEPARLITLRHDLYVIVGMMDRKRGVAGLQAHINPLVSFVWLGLTLSVLGALIPMWPDRRPRRARRFGYLPLSAQRTREASR